MTALKGIETIEAATIHRMVDNVQTQWQPWKGLKHTRSGTEDPNPQQFKPSDSPERDWNKSLVTKPEILSRVFKPSDSPERDWNSFRSLSTNAQILSVQTQWQPWKGLKHLGYSMEETDRAFKPSDSPERDWNVTVNPWALPSTNSSNPVTALKGIETLTYQCDYLSPF